MIVALTWLGLAAPARADDVPGEFSFTPPSGWTPSDTVRDRMVGPSVRAGFGYSRPPGAIFGVMLLVTPGSASAPVRSLLDQFVRGMVDVLDKGGAAMNVTRTETATTADVIIDTTRLGAVLRERCTMWVGRDHALHAACGMCVAPAATIDECAGALASIHITAPEHVRLPMASGEDRPPLDAAYELGRSVGRVVGVLALAIALLALFLHLGRRRTPR